MAIPVASALGRPHRLWPAVAVSAAAHALLVSWALARRPPPPIDLEQKPIIARLVRLGEKRPEELLPRKEAPAPAPAPPAPVAVPVAAAPPARPAAPAPAAAPPKPAPPSSTGKSGTTLASVLSRVQRDADQERYGAPDGDALGDSDSGSEGDRYIALVDRAIKANYRVPLTIPERERLYLETSVALWIEPDGRIARWRQERSSGNATFDAAVERTLKAAPRLPPPPDPLRRTGILLVFRARDT
jgi:colicin import membrane protein/protein TonB